MTRTLSDDHAGNFTRQFKEKEVIDANSATLTIVGVNIRTAAKAICSAETRKSGSSSMIRLQ